MATPIDKTFIEEEGGYGGDAASSRPPSAEVPVEPPQKPTKITLQLALGCSSVKADLGDYNKLSAEEVYEKAQCLKTLHLEWQNIVEIANLDPLESVEVLYLQYNRIEHIEGLDGMPKLQFLALQGNRIENIENLEHLSELEFLDLSCNRINSFAVAELPKSIAILNLKENPCATAPDHQERLQAHLPDLAYLDGIQLQEDDALAGVASSGPHALAGSSADVQLDASDQGLSAYYRKDGLQLGMAANIEEQIQAYGCEALGDVDGFTEQTDAAVKRSEWRRKGVEEQLTLVKQAMARTDARAAEAGAREGQAAQENPQEM